MLCRSSFPFSSLASILHFRFHSLRLRALISISYHFSIVCAFPNTCFILIWLPCRILCNNRDEFLARPALAAAFHSFGPTLANYDSKTSLATVAEGTVLSGRDTQSGGTWLGLAPQTGRLALLTNITEPYQTHSTSRGSLASAFLLAPPHAPLEELFPQAAYAGFNLLVLEADDTSPAASTKLHFRHTSLLSNGGAGGPLQSRPLRASERASGALSNGLHVSGAGGEAWPKVVQGRKLFADVLRAHDEAHDTVEPVELSQEEREANDTELAARLFGILRTTDPTVRAREELRRTVCVRPLEKTTLQAGATGPADWYGTRTASVVLVRRSGEALFVERDVWRLKSEAEGGVELYEGGVFGGTGVGEGTEPNAGNGAGTRNQDGERVFRMRVGNGLPR
ncbi:NRDE protein-domain-containing protein [Mycena galopus ATCC 62051]|nr:NRDE protein-domain-containing protein [Mycena galopus ATCC 62051]